MTIQLISICRIPGWTALSFSQNKGIKAFKLKYLLLGMLSVTTSFKILSNVCAALFTSSSISEVAVTNDLNISLKLDKAISLNVFITLYKDSHAANLILGSVSFKHEIKGVIKSGNNCSEICS